MNCSLSCTGASWAAPPWTNTATSWTTQQLLICIFTEQTGLPPQVFSHTGPGFTAAAVTRPVRGWILTSHHGNVAITLELAKAVSLSESLRKQIYIGSMLSQAERATYSASSELSADVTDNKKDLCWPRAPFLSFFIRLRLKYRYIC